MERFSIVLGDYIRRFDAVVSSLKVRYYSGIQLSFLMHLSDVLSAVFVYASGEPLCAKANLHLSPALLAAAEAEDVDAVISESVKAALILAAGACNADKMDVSSSGASVGLSAKSALDHAILLSDAAAKSTRYVGLKLEAAVGGHASASSIPGAALADGAALLLCVAGVCRRIACAEPSLSVIGISVSDTLVAFRKLFEVDALYLSDLDGATLGEIDMVEY